jgi:hypothetical protein
MSFALIVLFTLFLFTFSRVGAPSSCKKRRESHRQEYGFKYIRRRMTLLLAIYRIIIQSRERDGV